MVRVHVKRHQGIIQEVEIRDHAGYADAGQDLVCAGAVSYTHLNEDHFSTSYRLYRFENYIRSNVSLLEGHVAYMIINREDYERFQLTFNEAKEKVFVLGGVDEFEAWALFTEKERDENGRRIYNGSLRSCLLYTSFVMIT